MITVEDALAKVLALAGSPVEETVPLPHAWNRVLLQPAVARMTQPPFDAAAMDGYAVRAADTGQTLTVIGEAAAGHPYMGPSGAGTAVRIFTGAPVPAGYDRVVMQEYVQRDRDTITVVTDAQSTNIRPAGDDFSAGQQVAPGRRLTARDIGLLAAMNVPMLTVARPPRVAILAGGDELVPVGEDPAPGQIISSNDLAIAALVRAAGGEPHVLKIARDTEESLREGFAAAAAHDLLVTIGGASVGDHDLVGKVATDLGMDRSFYKVAMRPGKPLMAGRIGAVPMLGLPGNPVSAMVCGILFLRPLLSAMQGLPPTLALHQARLACDIGPEGNRQHYLRATLCPGDGLPIIEPFASQDSARQSLMAKADALLIRPAHDPARKAGEVVNFHPLSD